MNDEHVELLKQGVEGWNPWRDENPEVKPDLSGADLIGADLNGATLDGTELGGADLSQCEQSPSILANLELVDIKGLETVNFSEPAEIGLNTLSLTLRASGGRFTEDQVEFFLAAGVSRTLLEYLPSILETEPLQFYKCFISYSTVDEAFAEGLNQDLEAAGVKTWKWDRDAVHGRDLWQNIDHAIRKYDKTILICSADCLASPQVESEIRAALAKENRIKNANADRVREALAKGEQGPYVDADVIIPIRIDNSIFNWGPELLGEVSRRMIADFTSAERESDKYQEQIGKLVASLNPRAWPPRG